MAQSLSRTSGWVVPRIPGIDEYLVALRSEVLATLSGATEVADALDRTAARWRDITQRLGLEKQRGAYNRHLNLTD